MSTHWVYELLDSDGRQVSDGSANGGGGRLSDSVCALAAEVSLKGAR